MTPDSTMFHDLPPLLVAEVRAWTSGDVVPMQVLVRIHAGDDAPGVIYPLQWRHENLLFMAPGEKNAVAHGAVRFDHSEDFQSARILFSQYNNTATLRGAHLEGSIKAALAR